MYATDLWPSFPPNLIGGWSFHLAAAGVALSLILWASLHLYSFEPTSPGFNLPGLSLAHLWSFFNARHDFFNTGFQTTGQTVFKFNLLWVRPIGNRIRCSPNKGV
jgi:hypothetical protein